MASCWHCVVFDHGTSPRSRARSGGVSEWAGHHGAGDAAAHLGAEEPEPAEQLAGPHRAGGEPKRPGKVVFRLPHQCTAGTVQRWGLPVPLRSENGPTQDPNVRFHVFINGWVGWVRGFELQVLVKMGEVPPNHETKPASKFEVERFVFRMNTQRICCFHPGLPFDHFRHKWSPPIVACFTLVVFPFRINQ